MNGWQPIETCPDDGFFLVHEDGAIRAMFRTEGRWGATARPTDTFGDLRMDLRAVECISEPTHWMPLPEPPLATPGNGG